jgi:hypothetical protein
MKCYGDLSLVRTMTTSIRPVEVTEYGDIRIPDHCKEEILDYEGSSVWCSECGMLGSDEYEDHGVSDCWQEV